MPWEEELVLRRTRGSELHMADLYAMPTEEDEAQTLANRDIEGMNAHRTHELRGYSRRILGKSALGYSFDHLKETAGPEKESSKAYDHTPHALFVEMDELEGEQWVEQARYGKGQ